MITSRTSFAYAVFLALFTFASADCFAQKPELVVQTGHSGLVYSVEFSADGKTLASGSADKTIKLWEVATGRELRTLGGHSSSVESVAFSADGKTLASGSSDRTIRLWDVATGRELRTLTGHSQYLTSVAFSADGNTLASGSSDNTIKLWEVATGRELRTLTGHSNKVNSVAFSSDGTTLASAGWDNLIKLWEVATGRELRTLTGHGREVNSLAFTGDGKTLASASFDTTVKLWEVATGRELRTLTGHSNFVYAVAFSGDGKTLASGSHDKTIKLWDVSEGRELRTLAGHSSVAQALAFSADGTMLAHASFGNPIKLWEVATGRALRTLAGHSDVVWSVALSGDGKTLASSSARNKTIKVWEVGTGRELRTLSGHSGWVYSVEFSADGQMLASCSEDKTIKLWEVATGRELRTLTGHSGPVRSVAFSPDGTTLATGSSDQTIKLWEVATGRELRTFSGYFLRIAFSADGQTLASCSQDNTIKLWEVTTGRELHTLTGHSRTVYSVAFSADGMTLASASGDKTIKLWEVATGRELRTLTGHSDYVGSVAFSADGKTLASGSRDRTIKLWDVAATGRALRTLTGHSNGVTSIALSADGRFLVSGSEDATRKLWRLDGGELMASLIALDESDWAVVTPDSRFDASADGMKLMHWVVGNEAIGLEQLKERYYQPGLLAKLMGFSKEPLRDVSSFENPKLYPEVKYEPPAKGSSTLVVNLTNRGGGIGRVQVFINDKEFLADARDEKLKQNPKVSHATLNIDLSKAPGMVSGEENLIRVQAWNVENYISSRGDEKPWVAPGPSNKEPPEVYAIVGGISQYAGAGLKLSYAATDAVAMANAFELGAKRLFGADKVHLTLLSTANDRRAIAPTKANFNAAFAAVQRQAKPKDILIVYLAGHAITLQQGGQDTYCYLTQEAQTTDVSDPEVRKQRTVTSDDLRDWIKLVPANKQAIMLDTCAAGAAQEQFIAAARAGSGDAIRAIELAMDRTGSHFLMGSAADAESFETSHYGQGLLTYALLKGIKGEALDDARMVDINTLFRFAREEVEKLAKNIARIQKPKISAPKGDTFPVGQLTREDAEKIVLATPKPIILRPRFFEEQTDDDPLELEKKLRELLRDETAIESAAGAPSFGFSNTEDFQGGIRPIGRYRVEANLVTVMLRLRRDGIELFAGPMKVTGTKENIAAKVIEAIKAAIR